MEIVQDTNIVPQPVSPKDKEEYPLPGHVFLERRPNGTEYARYSKDCYKAPTKGDKTKTSVYHHMETLGKVINYKEGIFWNRARGIFKFTIQNGYEEVAHPERYVLTNATPAEVNLRFGTTWVLDEYLKKYGLKDVISSLPLDAAEKDTLFSLVAFKTFAKEYPYRKAESWYTGDYSSILYPKAILYPQSISIFLKKIGDEFIFRRFFGEYLNIVKQIQQNQNMICKVTYDDSLYPLLIDSTGLINSIETSVTAPCSHGGPATDQVRLIYIVDHRTSLPIYFRYVPGNVVDKTTLLPTIRVLKTYHIDIDALIMDAGFYSHDNIEEMLSLQIPFLLRLPENNKIFTNIVNDYASTLKSFDNVIAYNKRVLYVRQINIQISGVDCYAYLCLDPTKESKDTTNFVLKNINNDDFKQKYEAKNSKFGKFLLLSNKNINTTKIIDTYYARAKIEQIFDTAKNMTGLQPLGVHSEEALRGHLFLSFISSAMYSIFANKLSANNLFNTDLYYDLQDLRIDIYPNNNHIILELYKDQRQVVEALDLEYPFHVKAGHPRKAQAALDRKSKGRRGRPKGSKGKQKFITSQETHGSDSTATAQEVSQRKPGRPAGSKNKAKMTDAGSTANPMAPKRKPGRPSGSKNKAKTADAESTANLMVPKRKPGRPAGSKNKAKKAEANSKANSMTSRRKLGLKHNR
ncbi:MAG: transposase [Rickettsiales bacterium]|jgi:transposase|nr:transposase [Rickettsiales bacterium]